MFLVPGGRACINVANIGRKPYLPLNAFITSDMIELGYLMRGEIIWNKGASAGTSCAWGSWQSASNPVLRDVHEYILVFCKEDFKREKGKIYYQQKGFYGIHEKCLGYTRRICQESRTSCTVSSRTAYTPD